MTDREVTPKTRAISLLFQQANDLGKIQESEKPGLEGHLGRIVEMQRRLEEAIEIILEDWSESDGRAEITGLGGRSKNRNFGNSGFSGGCTKRLLAA